MRGARADGGGSERRRIGPDASQVRRDLAVLRPDLADRFDAALPGARAAVLGRLLGALAREPLPGLTARTAGEVRFPHGTVRFPAAASEAFAAVAAGVTAHVTADGGVRTDTGTAFTAHPDAATLGAFIAKAAFRPGTGDGAATDGPPAHGPASGPSGPGGPSGPSGPGGPSGPAALDDPGALVRWLWGDVSLAAEIDNSVANLALARSAHRASPLPAPGDPGGLGRVEQRVVDGHPLHPCCRTRGGMSTADVLAYAPEHETVVRLRRLRVPAERWAGDGPAVLLAHPWQAERLRQRYPWLRDVGPTRPMRPLMSLRTLAPVSGGPHVKTAVAVQMTSAVRTVSPAAIHNGPILSDLLRTLTADLPLDVLAETSAGAVLIDGEPQRHLAHLIREAPRPGPDELIVPLAAVAAVPQLRAAIDDPYRWWTDLIAVLVAPLLTVLDRGVALEAHGQNTLVVLRDGRPRRILYRDFGGVRVSAARLRAAGLDVPRLAGDLPCDDPALLRNKLAAALLGNAVPALVAALRDDGADPARLWAGVAAAVRGSGTADAAPLLRDPLPVKATTAMRLAGDPLDDLWAVLDNPLAA